MEQTMTQTKHRAATANLKDLVAGDADLARSLVREAMQEVLEAEMT